MCVLLAVCVAADVAVGVDVGFGVVLCKSRCKVQTGKKCCILLGAHLN